MINIERCVAVVEFVEDVTGAEAVAETETETTGGC